MNGSVRYFRDSVLFFAFLAKIFKCDKYPPPQFTKYLQFSTAFFHILCTRAINTVFLRLYDKNLRGWEDRSIFYFLFICGKNRLSPSCSSKSLPGCCSSTQPTKAHRTWSCASGHAALPIFITRQSNVSQNQKARCASNVIR